MYAYDRTEADQTDTIAVCATKEEWAEIYQSLGEVDPWLDRTSPAWKLEKALTEAGVI